MIETNRLWIKPWEDTAADLTALKAFLQDPDVMYAYEQAFSDDEVKNWLEWNLKSYAENGYGLWKLIEKQSGKIIGECGITHQIIAGESYPEIGYHLRKKYWHQGYAIESAKAVKAFGFASWHFPELISTVRDTNIASMNVAIRNGMLVRKRYIKKYRGIPMPHYVFSIKRSDQDETLSLG